MISLSPYVLVEITAVDEDEATTFKLTSGVGVETNDDQAAMLAGALLAVLCQGEGIGPDWAGVRNAIEAMPDSDNES